MTTSRSAPRSTRRSSWSTTRWRSRAGSTSPPGAGTRARIASTIPRRVDLAGVPYAPFHDVQAMVDGKAAAALAELARVRWAHGACERAPPIRPIGDPWPQSITPDLTDIDVGIARTSPALDDESEIREVEALFFDMVDRAERCLYIENQYLTSKRFAEHLAQRMAERPELEAVLVTPKHAHSWLEEQTMQAGLGRFMQVFADQGVSERIRFLYPKVSDNGRSIDTMVHSKVMIVDDRVLRVGSANLNNRSFGVDTECDLAFEATSENHRQQILGVRDRLVGHFCGVSESEVAAAIAQNGSLIKAVEALAQNGHSLAPIVLDHAAPGQVTALEELGDPERPIAAPEFAKSFVGERPPARRLRRFAKVIAAGLFVVLLMLAWRLTPLAALTNPHTIREWFADIAAAPAAPVDRAGGLCRRRAAGVSGHAADRGDRRHLRPVARLRLCRRRRRRQRDPDLWRRRADRPRRRSRTCWGRGSTASAAPSRGTACSRSPPCGWCRSRRSPSSISPPAPAGSRSPTTCSAPSSACCRGSC